MTYEHWISIYPWVNYHKCVHLFSAQKESCLRAAHFQIAKLYFDVKLLSAKNISRRACWTVASLTPAFMRLTCNGGATRSSNADNKNTRNTRWGGGGQKKQNKAGLLNMDLLSAWRNWFGCYTPLCRSGVYSSAAFIKIISRSSRMFYGTHMKKKKNTLKGLFFFSLSSLLISPSQSAHPCWEANVILSAFQVSSPRVARNEPETRWHWSKTSSKTLSVVSFFNQTRH